MTSKALSAAFSAVVACSALGACDRVPDPPRGLEVALVLDNSGSMQIGGKDAQLREASARFVDILRKARGNSPLEILFGSEDQLWLSVIPFAGRVNLRGREAFFEQPPPDPIRVCPEIRAGAKGGDDTPLSAGRLRHSYWARGPERLKKLVCPPNAMTGPTRWLLTLPSRLRRLSFAKRCTRFDLASLWAWRALSPRWWPAWHGDTVADADDRPGQSVKVVVLLTDGPNTPDCALDRVERPEADALFSRVCEAMKRKGIMIYAVPVGETVPSVRKLLSACASSIGHLREGKDLVPVMERLAQELAQLSPRPSSGLDP